MVWPRIKQSEIAEPELNLIAAAPSWLLILLACAIVAAAIEDGARLRISNLTILVVLAGAVVAVSVEGPTWMLWQNAAVFAVLLALGTAAFAGGWLGGGDVKLLAATGLWFDLGSAFWFIVLVFLAGGVVAICFLLSRVVRGRGFSESRRARIPYGIAIAVGALAMVALDAPALRHHERPLPKITVLPHQR